MDLSIARFISIDKPKAQAERIISIIVDDSVQNTIDPYNQESIDDSFESKELPTIIEPKQRFLASTVERINFDTNTYGIMCIRSTWARLGLLAPPTTVDAGFHGFLTMAVYNANIRPILIRPGDFIWNLLTIVTPHPMFVPYNGRYQDQAEGVTLPKAFS